MTMYHPVISRLGQQSMPQDSVHCGQTYKQIIDRSKLVCIQSCIRYRLVHVSHGVVILPRLVVYIKIILFFLVGID